jgi:hypothetical protein
MVELAPFIIVEGLAVMVKTSQLVTVVPYRQLVAGPVFEPHQLRVAFTVPL